ncbi:unnamed protein product, partial [Rangifer tarandus platyrhynchus]
VSRQAFLEPNKELGTCIICRSSRHEPASKVKSEENRRAATPFEARNPPPSRADRGWDSRNPGDPERPALRRPAPPASRAAPTPRLESGARREAPEPSPHKRASRPLTKRGRKEAVPETQPPRSTAGPTAARRPPAGSSLTAASLASISHRPPSRRSRGRHG